MNSFTDKEYMEKLVKVSQDVWRLSRNTLLVNLRFMDAAVSRLPLLATFDIETMMTDGLAVYYHPEYLLRAYKREKNLPTRYYLHMIFHCVFQHFFIDTLIDHTCWNLACDIAVEQVVDELHLSTAMTEDQKQRHEELERLQGQVKYMTAENLCRYFLDGHETTERMRELETLFVADDHDRWYEAQHDEERLPGIPDQAADLDVFPCLGEDHQMLSGEDGLEGQKLRDMWKNVSTQMQVELETFLKDQGYGGGCLIQNLMAVNREKYDYTEFLKKFAAPGEAMKINDEEFDYIFYTYGLQMYENMPLIEPLEYKEVKKVREFVVAIDTSGSTSGTLVQKFVQKTYNILKQEDSFYSKMNLHIIQCDAEIQEDVKITTQEEFERYLEHMEIKGQGGTDFKALFAYVDELIERHELTGLKGLIYFTDGYGEFPGRQPDYKVAVIYVEEGYTNPEVPVWAIKLVLRPEEI